MDIAASCRRLSRDLTLLILAIGLFCTAEMPALHAADWPTFRADITRSAATEESLPGNLSTLWTYETKQPPKPAWPEPARASYWQQLDYIEPRVVDDKVFHPIMAGDSVYFGSSADDQLYCLDAATGKVRWTHVTDGPIRFAPVVAGEHVYVGSDDGFVYCLKAVDGEIVWKHHVAGRDYRIPGNGRVINAWPIRTGLIVDDGMVYVMAGLFPDQGVFACALHSETGEVVWSQRTSHSTQGYILASDSELYVPTGRSTPVAFNRDTGRDLGSLPGSGGTFALLVDDALISGTGNSKDGHAGVADLSGRSKLVDFNGKHIVATRRMSYLLTSTHLSAIDRVRFLELTREINPLQARIDQMQKMRTNLPADSKDARKLRQNLADAAVRLDELTAQRKACEIWKVDSKHSASMILAGETLYMGGQDAIAAHNATTGKLVWQKRVKGEAAGMAVANGRLVVSTTEGIFYAFGTQENAARPKTTGTPAALPPEDADLRRTFTDAAQQIVQSTGVHQGFALVVGAVNGRLAQEIAARTELNVLIIDTDAARIAAIRQRLISQTSLYGSRIAAHHIEGNELPFADYFANLIVSESQIAGSGNGKWMYPENEIKRVLRPAGGVAWLDIQTGKPFVRPVLVGSGDWTHMYANTANTSNSGDTHTRGSLALQWFGGPGPHRMIDRHLRGPAPLAVHGKMFIAGDNMMLAVDAYNGTELWQADLPESQRYSMPYDAGYYTADEHHVYIAVKDECWLLNTQTGRKTSVINLPQTKIAPAHWGYLSLYQGDLFGSIQRADASRMNPSRDLINSDYNNTQQIVTSRNLFRLDGKTHQKKWLYEGGVILNPTITVANDHVYFIESRSADALGQLRGYRIPGSKDRRIPITSLVALNAQTGKIAWEQPIDLSRCDNIVYLLFSHNRLVTVGSQLNDDNDTWYIVRTYNAENGESLWEKQHAKGKAGAFTHGEQVHHPVILDNLIVAEPLLYRIEDGETYHPDGGGGVWSISRPGHSCGTMTGAGSCLFFRATNPTVLDLGDDVSGSDRFQRISPTRPGCWINIIPTQGLVLIPEASASCVCNFSLQTSMAFRPVPRGGDIQRPAQGADLNPPPPAELMHEWIVSEQAIEGNTLTATIGGRNASIEGEYRIVGDALKAIVLDGATTNMTVTDKIAAMKLPVETFTLESWVRVDEVRDWGTLVGGVQDNGDFERGMSLGYNGNHFYLTLATAGIGRLTYLNAKTAFDVAKWYHVVGTYDGGHMKLYVNGVRVGESQAQRGGVAHAPTGWFVIGSYRDDDEHRPMKGMMHQAAVYKGVMLPDQIKARFDEKSNKLP